MNKDYDTIEPIDEITLGNVDQYSSSYDVINDILSSSLLSTMNTTLGAPGSSGPYTITNGVTANVASTYQWPSITTGITTGILSHGINDTITLTDHANTPGALRVRGDAEFEGDLKIKGVSLADTLEEINRRLAILKPNPELESRWSELRELRERYQQLERELIDKEKVWNTLKD